MFVLDFVELVVIVVPCVEFVVRFVVGFVAKGW